MDIEQILKKKELIVSIAIIGLGLIIANSILQDQKRKIASLNKSIALEEQKISLGKELSSLNDKIKQAGGNYLKSSASLTLDKFKELAAQANVSIDSLASESKEDFPAYVLESYRLNLEADYHSLARFISSLESILDIVKIEELSIENPQSQMLGSAQSGKSGLKASLLVSVAFIKSE